MKRSVVILVLVIVAGASLLSQNSGTSDATNLATQVSDDPTQFYREAQMAFQAGNWDKAIELLDNAPGVTVVDNLLQNEYPMPIHAEGKDDTFVGRIREDDTIPNGLNLWIVSDNLRKGAALNAVQIAEELAKMS